MTSPRILLKIKIMNKNVRRKEKLTLIEMTREQLIEDGHIKNKKK